MENKTFRVLEFDKIRKSLERLCVSSKAKSMASALEPSDNINIINKSLDENDNALQMLYKKGNLPLLDFKDISPYLRRLELEGMLMIKELLDVANFLNASEKIYRYAKVDDDDFDDIYELLVLFRAVSPLTLLRKEIEKCILSENEVSDNASSDLRAIRKEQEISTERIHSSLNNIIRSSKYQSILQDNVITVRNGRYCVPIKQDSRHQFPGMIHDQSQSGSTLFIEPSSVVELNNKLKELEAKEKNEIERILIDLSMKCTFESDILKTNLDVISELDFIFAKANLAINMNASKPIFNEKGYVNIKKARHPLLDKDKVVPIDIYLGDEFSILLITGPNTGGKTVSLKTLGLLTLMGQSGLYIPAFDQSELSVFDNVYADIGDEQSIEQNLSTFSSHMANIVYILSKFTAKSLILFDELGAGTDPTEGAALAMAILSYIHQFKVRTAVTTHYSELKIFALETKGLENASCEFDIKTLRPTYKLLIGVPGKSNAFAIAKRLNLDEKIIDNAKEFISKESNRFEDVITDLEIKRREASIERDEAKRFKLQSEKLIEEQKKEFDKIELKKEKILDKARDNAKEIYEKAMLEAEQIIDEMKGLSLSNKNSHEFYDRRKKIDENISKHSRKTIKKLSSTVGRKEIKDIEPGDIVFLKTFAQDVNVLTSPNKNGDLKIMMGIMEMQVNIKDLLSSNAKAESDIEKKSSYKKNIQSRNVKSEIDLRGLNISDAIEDVDKYLDEAFLANLNEVSLIHGKGTGALRRALNDYLKDNKSISSFRAGEFGEGDLGVTIVKLKD